MASTPGNGSVLKVSISAVFTKIGQQFKFGGVKQTRPKIDFTPIDATVRTSIPGLKDSDAIPFTAFMDAGDASQAYLQTSLAGGLTESWKITYADAGACDLTFSGYLTELEYGEATLDNLVPISGIIQATTAITVAP